jgi:hypothetical protein
MMANLDLTTLQTGDCILFKGKGFISRGIQWFTNSEYSHVVIYIGGGKNQVIEATEHMVEVSDLLPLLKEADKVCVRRIPNLLLNDAEKMKNKAYDLVYEPYDYIQFAGLALFNALRKIGIIWGRLVANAANKMICSEVYAVCALTIPIIFKSNTALVTPGTLYATELLTTVWEGKYQ